MDIHIAGMTVGVHLTAEQEEEISQYFSTGAKEFHGETVVTVRSYAPGEKDGKILFDKRYFYSPGENFFGMADGAGKKIIVQCGNAPQHFEIFVEEGFETGQLVKIMEWCFHMATSSRGFAFVHGMAIADGKGNGIVCPAWKGTGKTTAFLRMVTEGEFEFVGDDWSIVDDKGVVYPYPKSVYLYRNDIYELRDLLYKHKKGKKAFLECYRSLLKCRLLPVQWVNRFFYKLRLLDDVLYEKAEVFKSAPIHGMKISKIILLRRSGHDQFVQTKIRDGMEKVYANYLFEHNRLMDVHRVKFMLAKSRFIEGHYADVNRIYQRLDPDVFYALDIPQYADGREIARNVKEIAARDEL